MQRTIPCLWYNGDAEEAAKFYVSLIPDSRIAAVNQSPADWPSGKAGDVLTVEFTLGGTKYVAMNGGPEFPFTLAVSIQVPCDDQAEIDRLWTALIKDGGQAVQCGWLKDRWGLSWQIFPKRLTELIADKDRARAKRAFDAMCEMVKIDLAAVEKAANAR